MHRQQPARRRQPTAAAGATCIGSAAFGAAHMAVQWMLLPSGCPTYFNRRHPVAACLQQHTDAGGGDALAQPAHHTTCSARTSRVGSHDASCSTSGNLQCAAMAAGAPGAPAVRTCDQNILHAANQCLHRPVQPRHRLPRCSGCSSCLLPKWVTRTGPGAAIAEAHSDVGMLCGTAWPVPNAQPASTFQPFF